MMSWPYPFVFAHRGAGRMAPENTLAAFRLGASRGLHGFECDARLSRDGIPFLLHDDLLDRTTNGQGPADSLDWSELARLDAGRWHSEEYAGERLALLEDAAAFCKQSRCALNIEIKPGSGRDAETGRVVAETAARCWVNETLVPLLSSFRPAALAAARRAAPHLPRALLLEALRPRWIEDAAALGCVAVVVAHEAMGGPEIHAAHRAGLRVLCYTVNDPDEAERLRLAQVDGLITDEIGGLEQP
jgi:glycerophosphoryl diester phosphodiesterase